MSQHVVSVEFSSLNHHGSLSDLFIIEFLGETRIIRIILLLIIIHAGTPLVSHSFNFT